MFMCLGEVCVDKTWWLIPEIPIFRKLRQENEKFKPNIHSKFSSQKITTEVLLIIAATTKISVLPCAYIVTTTGQKGSCLRMEAKE